MQVIRTSIRALVTTLCLVPFLAGATTFNMLSCCPGEQTATEARIVWHSDSGGCSLEYRRSDEATVHTASCDVVSKPVTFRDKGSGFTYYKYSATLSGLEPGREYVYRAVCGTERSAEQRFRTAGTSGSYNFLWMSDVHSHPDNPGKITNVNKLYADAVARTSSSGGIDFILFSGDYAKYGSRYDNWQQWNGSPTMTENMLALIVGNHEYYYTGGKTNVPGRSETKMWHNKWMLACRNDPQNGVNGLGTSYWFIRDSVLFVGIDSLVDYSAFMPDDLYANAVSYQKEWFRGVVRSQAGKFRYIIVAQHDPWIKKTSTSSVSNSDYRKWYPVFDEFQVDLALSSDDHVYHRSHPLRGDAKQSDTADGTIYMVSPCIDEHNSSTSLTTAFSGDAAKYLYTASESGAFGACWIEVRPNGLKVTYFWDDVEGSYSKKDEFTVSPKDRGSAYEYNPDTGGDDPPQPPAQTEFTWKGGYDASRIGSARNWEEGVAPPASGAETLSFPLSANTTVSNDYASLSVRHILFPTSDKRASFVGGPVTGVESIVNNASVTNKFKNAVTFSGPIDVTGEMDFPGGVTGTVPANHTTFRGIYNLTTTGDWTSPSGSRVPSGSTFSMPSGTFYCNAGCMTIEKNATVVANAAKMNRTTTGYLLQENDGVFKTTGVLTSSGTGAVYHYLVHTSFEAASEGLIALSGLKIDGAARPYANSYGGTYQMAIGDNGIKKKAGATGYFLIRNDNKPEYIGSWCNGNDYKIAIVDSNGQYPLDTQEYVLYGSRTDRAYNINFDTTDCFNAGVRNTVRDMSPICGAAPTNVSVGIYGSGTFRFENTAVNATGLYSGGTVVSNSATVAILAGSCPGRGDLSLRDTATLSVPDSAKGTANVFGTLTVNAGTSLVFAGLASGTTPLSVGGLTVGAGEQKPVISVNASGLAAGTYPLIASSSATVATADSFALSASGASDKTLALVKIGNSICLEVSSGVHGKWLGGNGGNRFSVAANWDDGRVPDTGEALDFSSVTSATTIEADVNEAFGAVTMGAGVVTFTGNLTATSFSDTSKIAVGANATVTLVGDLVFANATEKRNDYIVNAIAAGGAFVVTGDIVSSVNGKGYVVPTVNGGDGVIVAKGLAQNSSCSDNPSFRLVRDAAGTVRWVIGADGITGTKNYWLLNNGGQPTAIVKADDSDFTVSAKIGNREVATLRFDTTGRDGLGHTISLTGGIYREGKVYVEGTGIVTCGYVQSDSSNPFTVTDTATLALLSGSNIGTGGVTVNGGASLAVSGAGTATLGGTLTLQGGSRLVVGAAGAQGYSRLAVKSVSLAGNVTVGIPSQVVGTFPVLTRTSGSFTDADLGKLSLSIASPDAALASSLVIADGGKSIAVSTVAAWPANWNGGHAANVAMQTAFTAWAATPGNDATAARAEGAFLLGLDLADYTEDLKVVSVAIQGGTFTIDTNVDLTKVRGRLYVLVADSPADIERSGTKINGTVSNLSKLVEIDASAPAKFFKVGVDYAVEESNH